MASPKKPRAARSAADSTPTQTDQPGQPVIHQEVHGDEIVGYVEQSEPPAEPEFADAPGPVVMPTQSPLSVTGEVDPSQLSPYEKQLLVEEQADQALLQMIEGKDLPALKAALSERETNLTALQAAEDAKTKTPLALVIEAVGCDRATMRWPANEDFPQFLFHKPCIYGKSVPDQDCRHCVHVQLRRYGMQLNWFDRRYEHHGMVMPLADASKVKALAAFLEATGITASRSVQDEIHALKQLILAAEQRRTEILSREAERATRGPFRRNAQAR